MKWSIDIETYRNDRAFVYTDKVKIPAPGNIKDEKKIEAAIAKKRKDIADKHALTWWTGKIISVALSPINELEPPVCFYSHDEKEILVNLTYFLEEKASSLVGKSSKTFDFPYLVGRYMANELPVPSTLKDKNLLYDIDDFFGWSSASGQRGKLDAYLHGIGFDLKPMDGSMVGELYENILSEKDTWEELVNYNIFDAVATAKIAKLYWGE